MITSVLFDMDGVLIDSQPLHYEADQSTMAHFGVEISLKELEKYAGTNNLDRYTKFKELYAMDASVDAMVAYREDCIMGMISERSVGAIDGVRRLLADIKDTGLKTAVASSSSYAYIYAVLDKLELREFFDQVVSGEDVSNGKPAPDIFLKAAKTLGSTPQQCVVIEDSGNGVLAAVRANMKVVGFVNENSGKQDLSLATRIISSFFEIDGKQLMEL